jgi:hypothetical protein
MQGVRIEWLSFLVLDAQRGLGRRSEPEDATLAALWVDYGEQLGREPRSISSPKRTLNARTVRNRIHRYASYAAIVQE